MDIIGKSIGRTSPYGTKVTVHTRTCAKRTKESESSYMCVHGKPKEQALSNIAFTSRISLRQKPDSINVLSINILSIV